MDLDDQAPRLHLVHSEIETSDDVACALAIFRKSYRIDHVGTAKLFDLVVSGIDEA